MRLLVIGWQVALSFALMWLSGQQPIHLPGLTLPVTLQSMFAILLPLLFERRNAVGGILLYLALGGLGVPVFADGAGGYTYFLNNSGGYLWGFAVIASTTSDYLKGTRLPPSLRIFLVFIIQHVVLTITGVGWIVVSSQESVHFSTHVSPYLVGMFAKSTLGVMIYLAVDRFLPLSSAKTGL